MDWEAQDARAQHVRVWAPGRSKLREGFLPMKWNRVVNQGRNIQRRQVRPQLVSFGSCDDKEMIVARSTLRLQSQRQVGECFAVPPGNLASAAIAVIKCPQFDAQDRGMELVKAAVLTEDFR